MANKVKTNPDIKVTNNGSTWSFHVLTEAGREWVDENLGLEDWQWMGSSTFVVDHRPARELAQQMIDGSGLKIV